MLPINEIFKTIQGEGSFTGTPSTFIRTQGCNVGCPWCDTKQSWTLNPSDEVPTSVMLETTDSSPVYAMLSEEEIVSLVEANGLRHVVITGGEPLMHDLRSLSETLIDLGFMVQIETSGTSPMQVDPRAFVTFSPKIGMAGGCSIVEEAYQRADEVKFPVGRLEDVDTVVADVAPRLRADVQVWLQPLSQSPRATALCIESAMRHGYKLSIQAHKYLSIR